MTFSLTYRVYDASLMLEGREHPHTKSTTIAYDRIRRRLQSYPLRFVVS